MGQRISVKDQLRAISGALTPIPVLVKPPKYGFLGCRASAGRLEIDVPLWPPSKANQYEVITLNGHGSLKSSQAVGEFQINLALALRDLLDVLDLPVQWYVPKGAKNAKPLNPVFGADIEVDVEVHLYEPLRTNRDTDGVDKALFDVLTLMGIWRDDYQLGNRSTIRPDHVGDRDADALRVILTARPVASWARNPGGRPTTTRNRTRPAKTPPGKAPTHVTPTNADQSPAAAPTRPRAAARRHPRGARAQSRAGALGG